MQNLYFVFFLHFSTSEEKLFQSYYLFNFLIFFFLVAVTMQTLLTRDSLECCMKKHVASF